MEPDGGEEAVGVGLGVEDGRATRALVDHGQVVRSRRVPGVVPRRGRRASSSSPGSSGSGGGGDPSPGTPSSPSPGSPPSAGGLRLRRAGLRLRRAGLRLRRAGLRLRRAGLRPRRRVFALGGRLFASSAGGSSPSSAGCRLLYRSLLGGGDFGRRLAFNRVGHDVAGARREGGAAEERGEREAGGEPALAPGRVRARAGRGRARRRRSRGRLCVRSLRRGRLVAPEGPEAQPASVNRTSGAR